MIPIANRELLRESAASLTPWECLWQGIPRAYAILFFSPDKRFGWMLLVISLLAPAAGFCGLAGVFAAGALALALGFDRGNVRNGYLLFNPLLVCLTLGLLNRSYYFPAPTFFVLWIAAVACGLFLAVALQQWFGQQFGLSPQSIPAVLCTYALCFVVFSMSSSAALPVKSANPWLDLDFLPPLACAFFQSFGAIIFEPRTLPGVFVFLALLRLSPLTTIVASSSLAVGIVTLQFLGFPPMPERVIWCGFNFLLVGIALGTAYFVPSRASLLLAWSGAFFCAFAILAVSAALRYIGLTANALPYNLIVLTLVYALRFRAANAGLHPSPAPGMLPETAGRFVVLNAARFPGLQTPALALPLAEECTITQGVDGALTHRGAWKWALDFEIIEKGRRWLANGERLEDFHTFDKPVLAPCDGVVAAVVSHVRDNLPGENNPADNWGNHIVIYNAAGYYVLLAHLRQHSPLTVIGQRVICGELIARCGNSGRSPVPHLHLHVQNAPQLGAATRAFCLRNYLVVSGASSAKSLRYCTSGVPKENERLAFPTPLTAISSLFANWLPGEYRYRISRNDGANHEETIQLDFDEQGRFRLRSQSFTAQFTAFFLHEVFYATDYDGDSKSLLALMAIGIARIPCIADPRVTWCDFASAVPFHAGLLRRLHATFDPFFGPGLLAYDYSLQAGERGFEIHCQLAANHHLRIPAHTPRRITTTICAGLGVARLKAHLWNDTKIVAELLAPAPLSVSQATSQAANRHFIHQESTSKNEVSIP